MRPNDGATPHPIPRADFSLRRVGAMVLRYWYLLRGSWPRILELAYWPTMQMILWGYINQFMASSSGGGSANSTSERTVMHFSINSRTGSVGVRLPLVA